MPHDHVPMGFIHAGIKHVGFGSPAYIMKGNAIKFFTAIGDFRFCTGGFEWPLESAFVGDRFPVVGKHEIMINGPWKGI